MFKKIKWIVIMCIFVLTLVGCGNKKIADTETNKIETSEEDVDEPNKEDNTEQENNGTSDDTTGQENESTSNASDIGDNSNTTTTPGNGSNNNTTTKPSTGNTNNSGSGNTGNNNSGSNNTGSTNPNTGSTNNPNPGTTTQPVHEHNWTEIVEEEIHYYAWRTICGKCGTDMTDMTDDEAVYHSAIVCNSRYSTKYIEVDFVTENVVKTPVVVGYKCSCGAEKE